MSELDDILSGLEMPDAPPEETVEDKPDDLALDWARDVLEMSKMLGGKMSIRKAGSKRRYHIWEYGTKQMKDFMGQTLPKASAILDRAKAKGADMDSWLVKDENRSVEELKKFLREIKEEATA